MEEYAVTYERIVLNGYQIEHILTLEMHENINGHGHMHLTAVIGRVGGTVCIYDDSYDADNAELSN